MVCGGGDAGSSMDCKARGASSSAAASSATTAVDASVEDDDLPNPSPLVLRRFFLFFLAESCVNVGRPIFVWAVGDDY